MHRVAGNEWEIFDRFGTDQDGIGLRRESAHQLIGGATLKVVVLHRGNRRDGRRIDTVQVLKIASDIGETVLDRFHGTDSRDCGQLLGGRRRRGGSGGLGDGDIGTVGQFGVYFGLCLIGGGERGGGWWGGECEGEHYGCCTKPSALRR